MQKKQKKKIAIILVLLLVFAAVGVLIYSDFFIDEYTLTLDVEGQGDIQPETGIHEYSEGEVVEINASAAEGWRFSRWQGDITGEEPVIEVEMTEDKEITAEFIQEEYSLEIDYDEEQGSVEIEPEQDLYHYGDTVTLRAEPEADWLFSRWQGDIETEEQEIEITIEEDLKLSAEFARKDQSLDVQYDSDYGDIFIEPEQDIYEHGQRIELRAEPETGYRFERWEGDIESEEPVIEVEMTEDKEITAEFIQEEYSLEIDYDEEQGSVEIEPEQDLYHYGDTVTLRAEPEADWLFSRWQGDIETEEQEIEITIEEDLKLSVEFARKEHSLDLIVEGDGEISWEVIEVEEEEIQELNLEAESLTGSVTETESLNLQQGSILKLEAEALTGYEFSRWQGDITGEDPVIEIEMTEDKEIIAEFTMEEYSLEIDYNEEQGTAGIEPEQDVYYFGDRVTLEAQAADEYEFSEWTGDLESEDDTVEITVTEDLEISAEFARQQFELQVEYDELKGYIELEPDKESYYYGEEVVIRAVPEEGWFFDRWEGDINGEEIEQEIVIKEQMEIKPVFLQEEYTLQIYYDNEKGEIKIDPEQDHYQPGDLIYLTAEARDGFEFIGWEGDVEGTEPELNIELEENTEIRAEFAPERYTVDLEFFGVGDVELEPEQEYYYYGDEITIRAIPDPGWEFMRWSGDIDGEEEEQKIVITEDINVEVRFRFEK